MIEKRLVNKAGRKFLYGGMYMDKRESTVTITVNDEERQQLKQAAKDARLTVSGYCRAVLFGQMAVKEVVRSKTF